MVIDKNASGEEFMIDGQKYEEVNILNTWAQ